MEIGNITGTSIWSSLTRNLTDVGSGAMQAATLAVQTIAAAASVDFRNSVGINAEQTIAVKTGGTATGSIAIQLWDGTAAIQCAVTAAAANSPIAFSGISCNVAGLRVLNNDAAVAGTYIFTAIFWKI